MLTKLTKLPITPTLPTTQHISNQHIKPKILLEFLKVFLVLKNLYNCQKNDRLLLNLKLIRHTNQTLQLT